MKTTIHFETTLQVLLLLAVALLPATSGCKSSGDDPGSGKVAPAKIGPTGVPEVTLRAASEDALRAGISDFFEQRGYAEGPARFTDELAFDRPSGPSSESATRAARVRVRYSRVKDGRWRVVATAKAVENWKSSLESERAVLSAAEQMQGFLNVIKERMEGQP